MTKEHMRVIKSEHLIRLINVILLSSYALPPRSRKKLVRCNLSIHSLQKHTTRYLSRPHYTPACLLFHTHTRQVAACPMRAQGRSRSSGSSRASGTSGQRGGIQLPRSGIRSLSSLAGLRATMLQLKRGTCAVSPLPTDSSVPCECFSK